MGSEEGTPSPDEAFKLLGDGTRIAILRAVWASGDEPVPFSALRERVGNPDSGQFNYHLNRLAGHFLSRVDGGYALTQAGREVVRAVLAGTMTRRPDSTRARIDARCATCGGALVAEYDEYARIECADCSRTVMWNEFPPAGLEDRTPAAFASAFDRWTQGRFRLAMDGVCPSCAAETTATVVERDTGGGGGGRETDGDGDGDCEDGIDGEADATDEGDEVVVDYRCGNCRYEARVPLFGHALRHPAVVCRYYEAGVDVTRLPFWELQGLAASFDETVVSEEPWRARVTAEVDGRRLSVTLDGGLDVVDVADVVGDDPSDP